MYAGPLLGIFIEMDTILAQYQARPLPFTYDLLTAPHDAMLQGNDGIIAGLPKKVLALSNALEGRHPKVLSIDSPSDRI